MWSRHCIWNLLVTCFATSWQEIGFCKEDIASRTALENYRADARRTPKEERLQKPGFAHPGVCSGTLYRSSDAELSHKGVCRLVGTCLCRRMGLPHRDQTSPRQSCLHPLRAQSSYRMLTKISKNATTRRLNRAETEDYSIKILC